MVGGAVVPEHGMIQIDVAGSRWPDQRYKDPPASGLQTFFFHSILTLFSSISSVFTSSVNFCFSTLFTVLFSTPRPVLLVAIHILYTKS